MPSKIALHVLTPSPAIDALIGSAPWAAVKAVGNPAPLAVAAQVGIAIRILRQYGVEAMDPAGAVAAIAAHDLSYASHIQIVCEDNKGYDPVWQLAVMDGLRARGYTARYLLCGAATGNPPKITGDPPHFPELEPLYGLLRRPDTDLALDAYTGLLVMDPRWAAWAPYTVFRPTLIRADLARQGIPVNVVVTESGGDNIAPVTTGGGWQSRNWSSDEYLQTLLAVDADDQAHPWLLARCLFTSGPTPDWWAFDIQPVAAQLAAYVATQAGNAPQRAQDAPTAPQTPPTAPAPVTSSHAPVLKIGHAMPAPIFAYDQGWTKDCWLRCTEAFFLRYGYALSVDQIFQAAKGRPYPAGGEAATFAEVERGIRALAVQLGVKIQLAEFNDPPTVWNALHDADTANPWTIIIGVEESVLQGSSQQYGHFMVLDKDLGGGNVHVVDSYGNEDGDATGVYPWSLVAQAMIASWEPAIDAIGVKIVGNAG